MPDPAPAPKLGDVTLVCRFCGYEGALDLFCSTPRSGDLPKNVFQCPSCRRAVRKTYGKPEVFKDFVIHGDVTFVEIEPVP